MPYVTCESGEAPARFRELLDALMSIRDSYQSDRKDDGEADADA